jgi:hypothetical protein
VVSDFSNLRKLTPPCGNSCTVLWEEDCSPFSSHYVTDLWCRRMSNWTVTCSGTELDNNKAA